MIDTYRVDEPQFMHARNLKYIRHNMHNSKMEEMAGGLLPESFSPINKSLKASPYSILRKSDEIEVQETMEKMHERALAANHGGARTTRTELLRQLALK